MYKKGDKFVMEIDNVIVDEEGEVLLYTIKGFNALVFDQYGLDRLSRLVNGVDKFSEHRGYGRGYSEGIEEGIKRGVEMERARIRSALKI